MACFKVINTSVLLLALISAHAVLSGEARQLKAIKKQGVNPTGCAEKVEKQGMQTNSNRGILGDNEQIRGNAISPMNDNHARGKKNILPPLAADPYHGFGNSAATYSDELETTRPGNSPGMGHSATVHNEAQDSYKSQGKSSNFGNLEESKYESQATGPGHSPGVGHSFQTRTAEP